MINLILQILINQLMLCEKLWFLWVLQHTNLYQQVLGPVGALDFIQVELRFQGMIYLVIWLEQMVDNLDNWIIETERLRIRITTQFTRNKHLLTLFKL